MIESASSADILPGGYRKEPAAHAREKDAQSGYREILDTLDEDQRAACLAEGPVNVAARPGSGKTRLLVARTLRGILEHGPEQVIAITFTRAAAQEMRRRVAAFAGAEAARKTALSTFHSWALSFRRGKSRIIDDRDRFLVLMHLLRENGIRIPAGEVISKLPDFFNQDRAVIATLPAAVISAMEQYRDYLKNNRMTDLDAVVPDLAHAVETGKTLVQGKLLLVDEFQDVDPAQLRLVIGAGGQGVETFCVGDDDQSIYGFRRSLGPAAFNALESALGSRRIFLRTNYRCARAIAVAAEQPLLCLGNRIEKPLRILRDGGEVAGIHFDTVDEEMVAASDYMERCANRGESCAILARTNHVLDAMEGVLRVAGVPYERADSRSFWDLETVRRCLAMIRLAYRPSRHETYIAMHAIPLPHDTIRGVHEFLGRAGEKLALEDLLDLLYDRHILEGAHAEIVEYFREWRGIFCAWAEHCRDEEQWEAAGALMQAIASRNSKAGMINAAAILEGVFSRKDRNGGRMPVEERMRLLELPKKTWEQDGECLKILTIHAAKGLEFPSVWILGARDGILPHQDSTDEDEERRILYVGMTRAIDHLVISNSREKIDKPFPAFSFGLRLEAPGKEEETCTD